MTWHAGRDAVTAAATRITRQLGPARDAPGR